MRKPIGCGYPVGAIKKGNTMTNSFYDQLQKIKERKYLEEPSEFERGYRAAMRVLADHKQDAQIQMLDFNFEMMVKKREKTNS